MSPLVQADGEVQLQDDWIQPTRETEPEDGGKVQAPAEGDTLQNLFGQLSYQGQTTMDILPNTSQYFHFILPTSLRRLKWRKSSRTECLRRCKKSRTWSVDWIP